jgi:hypothetical protein
MLTVWRHSSPQLRQGEPHAGERPDRRLGRFASEAGKRGEAVATDRWAASTEIRKPDRNSSSFVPHYFIN